MTIKSVLNMQSFAQSNQQMIEFVFHDIYHGIEWYWFFVHFLSCKLSCNGILWDVDWACSVVRSHYTAVIYCTWLCIGRPTGTLTDFTSHPNCFSE